MHNSPTDSLCQIVLRLIDARPIAATDLHCQILLMPGCTDVTIAGVYKALHFWAEQGAVAVGDADYQAARTSLARLLEGDLQAQDSRVVAYQITDTGRKLLELAQQR